MAKHRETAKHLAAFEAWYAAGREVLRILPEVAVAERTVRLWAEQFGWHLRADQRDREAKRKADHEAIKKQVEILTRQRQTGELMARRGTAWYAKHEIDNAKDAKDAVKEGFALERQAAGVPDWVVQIVSADESSLDRQLEEMERRGQTALSAVAETSGDALAVATSNGKHLVEA